MSCSVAYAWLTENWPRYSSVHVEYPEHNTGIVVKRMRYYTYWNENFTAVTTDDSAEMYTSTTEWAQRVV